MSDVTIGQLLTGKEQRDAIHVAVAPVVATERLAPGQHIGFSCEGDTEHVNSTGPHLGIVDPYLKAPVFSGERFWMFLYPKSVTGMRHEWQHPAFTVSESAKPSDKDLSETWLKDYVGRHCSYWREQSDGGYAEFLRYVEQDRWIYYYGSDCHGLADVEDADELFRHLSVILGRKIDATYFEAFTCSC